MSDPDSAATEPRWNSEVAEKWLSRVDATERSGAPIRQLLIERAHLQPGERVLDVGCGSGPSTAAAATEVHPGGMVTGYIAAPMISAARQRVGDRDIEWIVGDAENYAAARITALIGWEDQANAAAVAWIEAESAARGVRALLLVHSHPNLYDTGPLGAFAKRHSITTQRRS